MKWLTLMLSCWATLAFAQRKQVFKLNPIPIEQGQELDIHYDPSLNGVPASTQVKGSIYLFKNFSWQGYDLPLIKSDSGYTAKYQVPEGVSLLAVRYALGDSIDCGRRFPYAVTISNSKGKMVDGGTTEWGLLRSKDLEGNMSPLVSAASLIEPKTLIQLWISPEYQVPIVRRNLFVQIANGIKNYFPKVKADSILYKGATELAKAPDVTEKELIRIEKVYRIILKNVAKADSIKIATISKYPKGIRFRLQLINEISLEQNKGLKLTRWNNFVKDYPFNSNSYADYRDPIIGDKTLFDPCYVSVADITLQKHDLSKLTKLIEEAPIELINSFYKRYVIGVVRDSKSPITEKETLFLSTSFTSVLMSRIAEATLIDRGIFAPTEWIKEQMNNNTEVWAHHINLLYKSGRYNEAMTFSDRIKDHIAFKSLDFNTIYVKLMYHFNQKDAAKAYILMAKDAGKATPEIIDLLNKDQQQSKRKKSSIPLKS